MATLGTEEGGSCREVAIIETSSMVLKMSTSCYNNLIVNSVFVSCLNNLIVSVFVHELNKS